MQKVSAIFVIFVVTLFSIAIVTNLWWGIQQADIDLTGFVSFEGVQDVEFELNGEICTDSDNGRAYVRGETAVFNSVAVDYCLDDTRLVEYSCATLFRTSEVVVCPYGCKRGACV